MGYYHISSDSEDYVTSDDECTEETFPTEQDTDSYLNVYGALVEFAHARGLFQNSTYSRFVDYIDSVDLTAPMTRDAKRMQDKSTHTLQEKKLNFYEFIEYKHEDIDQMVRIARQYGLSVDNTFPSYVFEETRKTYSMI